MSRVVDASAAVDLVLGRPELTVLLAGHDLHVPAHFDVECLSAIRGAVLRGVIDLEEADAARARLGRLHAVRYPLPPLLDRAWELRDRVAIQDGAYVALAEGLRCPLVTVDERLARAAADLVDVEPAPPPPDPRPRRRRR